MAGAKAAVAICLLIVAVVGAGEYWCPELPVTVEFGNGMHGYCWGFSPSAVPNPATNVEGLYLRDSGGSIVAWRKSDGQGGTCEEIKALLRAEGDPEALEHLKEVPIR